MVNEPMPRLDTDSELMEQLRPSCRIGPGELWVDPVSGHRVICGDAADIGTVHKLCEGLNPTLAVHDPPYNLVAFETRTIAEFIAWCSKWIDATEAVLSPNSALYVWLGADQNDHFQPLADFMILMRSKAFQSRSFITMRNQRGYGTQHNWMAVRQELLYYIKGSPAFNVDAEYTDIPKILRGYYKEVNGVTTENTQRGKSDTIRAGNVWVDIQQVFYRLHENVSGCFAQKPLAAIERCIQASSQPGDAVLDLFSHSGTTLLASERLGRVGLVCDIEPVFCEITIRRLEHFRKTGRTGWQNGNAFLEPHGLMKNGADTTDQKELFSGDLI